MLTKCQAEATPDGEHRTNVLGMAGDVEREPCHPGHTFAELEPIVNAISPNCIVNPHIKDLQPMQTLSLWWLTGRHERADVFCLFFAESLF